MPCFRRWFVISAWLSCILLGAKAQKPEPKPPGYVFPAFTNWDCIETKDNANWDALYETTVGSIRNKETGDVQFVLPEEALDMLQNRLLPATQECPLGALYFLAIYTYEAMAQLEGEDAVRQSEFLSAELRRYPFYLIAGARWPTYEVLHHFSSVHRPMNDRATLNMRCDALDISEGEGSGVEWTPLFAASKAWTTEQLAGHEPGEGHGDHGILLKTAADQIYRDPNGKGDSAQKECPFGFLFLCATQALAAAQRLTGSFDPWARAVDMMLAELPYFSISGSGWPTYQILAMFSSLSKGEEAQTLGLFQADVHRWGGTHPASKRFRQYGDLRLKPEELAPYGRNEAGWQAVDGLASLRTDEWYGVVISQRTGKMRRIFAEAFDAVLKVMRASMRPDLWECGFSGIDEQGCKERGCSWGPMDDLPMLPSIHSRPFCRRPMPTRKLVLVTFVWGERWAPLVPRFVAWASTLRLGVIVVAMGDACRTACEAAASAGGGAGSIACWDPLRGASSTQTRNAERGSILQRHAIVHILLHLGIDAAAFDFDTFFFSDPRRRLEQIAEQEGADVLMARHLDAECMNMGFLYVRASAKTAEWYSRYLEWLHQHPYEREQRGANALLGFTNQRVSFSPKNMPQVRAASLDDLNEFSSSRGGWLGDWSKLIFFHWVNPMETHTHWSQIKVDDLKALLELALHPTTDISIASNSLARLLGAAQEGSLLFQVKNMMLSMMTESPPTRAVCW